MVVFAEPAPNLEDAPSGHHRPRATWGVCQRCKRRTDRGYITTSSGDLLVCVDCYVEFRELPADHPARPR